LSPQWELAALQALVKPQLADRIRHRPAEQPWPQDGHRLIFDAARDVARRLSFAPSIHLPQSGDYHFIAEIDRGELESAKALALVLSARLPGLWLVLGRLFIRDRRFYSRQRPRGLSLARAPHIHVQRNLRTAIRDLLRPASGSNP
jgi:hypothetical protein